jgi:hypothetical protein
VNLKNDYSRYWRNRDFGYEWKITIPSQNRVIDLTNFQPFMAQERKKPYPAQLVKLGCSIWRLRVDVSDERLEKNWLRGCEELGF